MAWTLTDDIGAFAGTVKALLSAQPERYTVLATVLDSLVRHGPAAYGDEPPVLATWTSEPGGEVRAAALQTPPHPLQVTELPGDSASGLAAILAPRHVAGLTAVNGGEGDAIGFAGAWSAVTGLAHRISMRQRGELGGALHGPRECRQQLAVPQAGLPGRRRQGRDPVRAPGPPSPARVPRRITSAPVMTNQPPATEPVTLIAGLFDGEGASEYLGEDVTQAAHMLQAASLAVRDGAAPPLVAAALLHDVGHFTGVTGAVSGHQLMAGTDNRHSDTGAAWLAQWFGPAVTEPVRLHVAAKRYLCAVEPGYAATLSPASAYTLGVQGGPMSGREASEFAASPHADDACRLRRWDDAAKDPDAPVPAFGSFRPLLEGLLTDRAVRGR